MKPSSVHSRERLAGTPEVSLIPAKGWGGEMLGHQGRNQGEESMPCY